MISAEGDAKISLRQQLAGTSELSRAISAIGLSFENYRGQPDLLDHAKSLVRILRGQEKFKKLGGDMPKRLARVEQVLDMVAERCQRGVLVSQCMGDLLERSAFVSTEAQHVRE